MKKKSLVVLLAAMLAFAGCGKKDEGKAPEPETVQEMESEPEEEPQEEAAEEEPEDKNAENECGIELISHTVAGDEKADLGGQEPEPYAFVVYGEFSLNDAFRETYPKLSEILTEENQMLHEDALRILATYTDSAKEYEEDLVGCYSCEDNISITRADSAILSYRADIYDWSGGAHPNSYYRTANFDVKDGKRLLLEDVITVDDEELFDVIYENLVPLADPEFDLQTEEYENVKECLTWDIESKNMQWTLNDETITFYFPPYDLAAYAVGPIWAEVSYEKYPALVKEEYLPTEEKITIDSSGIQDDDIPMEELEQYMMNGGENMEEEDGAPHYYVENPEWDMSNYMKEGTSAMHEEVPFELTKVGEEKSDWIDPMQWAYDHELQIPSDLYTVGYGDELYYYYADNRADEEILEIELAAMGTYQMLGIYDFSSFLDTPTGNEYTTFYIPYAKVYDGVLYAEIAHRTYAEDQPYTGFIVAVDLETGEVIWRSEMQVANGNNFIVGEDVIICGYGFTAEPDHMYFLSRKTGVVLDEMKVNSAPDYFIPEDDSLYVICYNTVYEFNVEEK
ncbi:MAG: DUF4163 domain-containing protein [Lachnospiraceae bacterium]|nr:DUF4163 domain-containing protein [Lachnospiraceae bacterium]